MWRVDSSLLNPQTRSPPFVACLQLLIQYICSYHPYLNSALTQQERTPYVYNLRSLLHELKKATPHCHELNIFSGYLWFFTLNMFNMKTETEWMCQPNSSSGDCVVICSRVTQNNHGTNSESAVWGPKTCFFNCWH